MSFWKELEALEKEIHSLENENKTTSKRKKTKPPVPKYSKQKKTSSKSTKSNTSVSKSDHQINQALSALSNDVEKLRSAQNTLQSTRSTHGANTNVNQSHVRSIPQETPVHTPARQTQSVHSFHSRAENTIENHSQHPNPVQNHSENEALAKVSLQLSQLGDLISNQSHSVNINTEELGTQLRVLETEIEKLGRKENTLHQTASDIRDEVKELHTRMPHIQTNTHSHTHESSSNHIHNNVSAPNKVSYQGHTDSKHVSGGNNRQSLNSNVSQASILNQVQNLQRVLINSHKLTKEQKGEMNSMGQRIESLENALKVMGIKLTQEKEQNARLTKILDQRSMPVNNDNENKSTYQIPEFANVEQTYDNNNTTKTKSQFIYDANLSPESKQFEQSGIMFESFDIQHGKDESHLNNNNMQPSAEKVMQMQEKIADLEKMLNDTTNQLENERSEYLSNMRETTHQLVALKSEHEMYKNRLARSGEMMHLNNKNIASLQRQIKELETKNLSQQQQYQFEREQHQIENQKLSQDLKNTKIQLRDCRTFSTKLENDNKKLETKIADKQQLLNKYNDLRNNYEDVSQKLLKQERLNGHLEKTCNEYKVLFVDAKQEVKELTTENSKLQDQIHEKQKEYHFATNKMRNEYQEQIDKMEAELTYVKNCYHELKIKYADVKTKLSQELPRYKALREGMWLLSFLFFCIFGLFAINTIYLFVFLFIFSIGKSKNVIQRSIERFNGQSLCSFG